jgi:WD40 repeat protein
MKSFIPSLCLLFGIAAFAGAQATPSVVWSAPTPGLLANDVGAVAWSPTDDALAVGSSDRWFRLRQASTGALLYSVLEPKNSGGPGDILFSHDGQLIGVRNDAFSMEIRVQRMLDGVFMGKFIASVGADGLLVFTPDAMLVSTTGGSLAPWDFSQIEMRQTTGSGYQKVTTTFNFSPNGQLQTAAAKGLITVRRTIDGAVVKTLRGQSPVHFSHDSRLLAAASKAPTNVVVVWQTANWSALLHLPLASTQESAGGLRFTADDQRLVATGYTPYLDPQGLWQQKGFIRFWTVPEGALLVNYDKQTDLAVTSAASFSPDGSKFAYGLYNGTVAVAQTP